MAFEQRWSKPALIQAGHLDKASQDVQCSIISKVVGDEFTLSNSRTT